MVYTTIFTIHAGASETITIDGVYGSFTTNADGNVNHALPFGELTLHGSVSGQSFTRTITNDTTEVYVRPENSLYWCGYCDDRFQTFCETGLYEGNANQSIWGGKRAQLDLSGYKKICVDQENASGYTYIGVMNGFTSNKNVLLGFSFEEKYGELDISDVVGNFYIAAGAAQYLWDNRGNKSYIQTTDYSTYYSVKCTAADRSDVHKINKVWLE